MMYTQGEEPCLAFCCGDGEGLQNKSASFLRRFFITV
jgi:hypothetical protein